MKKMKIGSRRVGDKIEVIDPRVKGGRYYRRAPKGGDRDDAPPSEKRKSGSLLGSALKAGLVTAAVAGGVAGGMYLAGKTGTPPAPSPVPDPENPAAAVKPAEPEPPKKIDIPGDLTVEAKFEILERSSAASDPAAKDPKAFARLKQLEQNLELEMELKKLEETKAKRESEIASFKEGPSKNARFDIERDTTGAPSLTDTFKKFDISDPQTPTVNSNAISNELKSATRESYEEKRDEKLDTIVSRFKKQFARNANAPTLRERIEPGYANRQNRELVMAAKRIEAFNASFDGKKSESIADLDKKADELVGIIDEAQTAFKKIDDKVLNAYDDAFSKNGATEAGGKAMEEMKKQTARLRLGAEDLTPEAVERARKIVDATIKRVEAGKKLKKAKQRVSRA